MFRTVCCSMCGSEWWDKSKCDYSPDGKHSFIKLNVYTCGEKDGNTLVCLNCSEECVVAEAQCPATQSGRHQYVEVDLIGGDPFV